MKHLAHKRGLARAAHASDDHKPVQRNFDGEILEVVMQRAADSQSRAGVSPAQKRRGHVMENQWLFWQCAVFSGPGQARRLPYFYGTARRDFDPFFAAEVLAG